MRWPSSELRATQPTRCRPFSADSSASGFEAAVDETLAVVPAAGLLPTAYRRWTGPMMSDQPDLAVPMVGGQPAYVTAVFHSTSGNHVLWVQTGSNIHGDPAAAHHVIYR
jgi:hypothetical protein